MADIKSDQDEKAIDDKVEDTPEVDKAKTSTNEQADEDKPQAADEEVEIKKKDHKKKVKTTKTDDEKDGKDDNESSEEEMLGLFDKDVLVEGKRERKKVSRLSTEIASPHPKPDAGLDFSQGKGTRLGDIEWVEYEIKRCTSDELKPLHRLLYGRDGKMKEVKKNIRNFCGYPFTKQDALYKKKEEAVDRFTVPGIKRMCEIFAVKKGTRDEMMSAIIEFLMKPADSGKKIPPPKEKKSAKKKSSTSTKTVSKKAKSKQNADSDKEADNDDDEEEEDAEEEEEKPAKKAKKTPEKKTPTKKKDTKSPKKAKSASKEKKPATKVKLPSKTKSPAKRKTDQSDDDDEPLIKKAKSASSPSDDDIKKSIHGILDGADLESITMKIVCKQVAENFPNHDLSPKKKFIKETVKEMIS